MGEVKTVRTSFPSTLDDLLDGAKWAEFGIFLGIILTLPIIFGSIGYISTMLFCCFRCCGFCGSNVPTTSEAYKKKDLLVPGIILAVIYGSFIVLAIIGVVFSARGSTHVRVMLDETFILIESVTNTLNNAKNIPNLVITQLNDIPDSLDPLFDKVLIATSPLDSISTLVNNTIIQLSSFNSTNIETMDRQVLSIKGGIEILRNSSNLGEVPPSSDIPDIKATVSPSITAGLESVQSAKVQIDSGKETIESKISSVKSMINDTISNQLSPSLEQVVGGVIGQIDQIQSQIDSILSNETITDAKTYSKLAENIRVSLSIVLFCWCGIIYILVFLGLIFRKSWCVHFTTVLAFITAWIFILLAAVQVPAFIFINETCSNGPKIIGVAGDELLSNMMGNGTGIRFQNVSGMLTTLYTCKPGQSLLDVVFGSDTFSALGISNLLNGTTESFGDQVSAFNISSITDSASSSISSSSIGSINVDYTADIISARSKVANGTSALNNLSGFAGFNQTDFDAALNALNEFTNQKIGQNFTYSNFETFDTAQFSNNNERNEAETLKNATRLQYNMRLSAIEEIAYYNNTLNTINTNMDDLLVGIDTAKGLVSSFGNLTSDILAEIDTLTNNIQDFMTTFPKEILEFVTTLVKSLLKTVGAEFGCSFLAVYIQAAESAVCGGIGLDLLITGIACFFIGMLMHVACFVNIIIAKRIKYQAGNRVHPNLSLEMN